MSAILETVSPIKAPKTYYSTDEKALVNPQLIPRHIAIIPDGNRRWAKANQLVIADGHREGANNFLEIVKAAKELGVEKVTFYGFSTENWNRSETEVMVLFLIIAAYLKDKAEEMIDEGVKLEVIGNIEGLPLFLREQIDETKQQTSFCHQITLILAINYGARDELCRAFSAMLSDYDQQVITKENITEKTISNYLDTTPWGDPDLFIRTSGELRVSNFLLWQIAYSEIFVSSSLWPDFTSSNLLEAVLDYQKRDRRWGGK